VGGGWVCGWDGCCGGFVLGLIEMRLGMGMETVGGEGGRRKWECEGRGGMHRARPADAESLFSQIPSDQTTLTKKATGIKVLESAVNTLLRIAYQWLLLPVHSLRRIEVLS